jgi:hypothetical protein
MRILLRLLAAVAALGVVAVVAAALLLPRLLDSDSLRERIGVAAEDALGRDVHYGTLGFALFPPVVVVERIRIGGEAVESPPLLAGERLSLGFSLLPLLARTLVVDSVSLRGVTGTLIRTEEGFAIPSRAAAADGAGAPGPVEGRGAGLDLAVASFDLEDASFALEDRSVSPAVNWELRELSARARGTAVDAPVGFDFDFVLASGGRVHGEGEASLAGVVEATVTFDDVAVAPLRAYVDSGSTLAGRLSGTAVASGPAANLESLRVDAMLADGRFQLDDMTILGPVKLVAALHGPVAALRGTFEIEATEALVRYGGMFTKPPGDAATVEGRLVDGAGGSTAIDDLRIKIRNFKGTAYVEGGAQPRVAVNAAPFGLLGWDVLIPMPAD